MFVSVGVCPLSYFVFVISMDKTPNTAGGEDTVEFVHFTICFTALCLLPQPQTMKE